MSSLTVQGQSGLTLKSDVPYTDLRYSVGFPFQPPLPRSCKQNVGLTQRPEVLVNACITQNTATDSFTIQDGDRADSLRPKEFKFCSYNTPWIYGDSQPARHVPSPISVLSVASV